MTTATAPAASAYYYGDEAEQFTYIRIPCQLITHPRFKHLSTDAKLLYAILLDRMSLSVKHQWYDTDGRVYIYYTVDEICSTLTCGRDKAMKLLAELDTNKGIGLIERVKQGQGKPTKIYVRRFTTQEIPPESFAPFAQVEYSDGQKSFLPSQRSRVTRPAQDEKPDCNHIEIEQLDADTETLLSIGREHLCQFSVLRYQQEDGLNTVLPYGLRRVRALRTLTTESAAVLMPFRVQEIQDPGGLSYGVNAISHNLLICDRKRLISPHGFYLGVSGSGKSMGMKDAITEVVLGTGDDVIIIDAEREYGPLAKALGGEIIEISPHSQHHISPLDLASGYDDDENPVAMKSEIITSILEQQMGVGRLSASHKSIIDRCTANIYQRYFKERGKAAMPLLTDWRDEVLRQTDPEARELALAAELITEGSLNVFAHATNVNMDNRLVVLDLYEMGEQLRPTALVVTLEAIQNRVMDNRKRGKFTWVFIDECYLYFKYHYSGEFLYRAWKRFRKYAGIMTAATQNVEECLKSETARLMLANSEFLLLFNQSATDRAELSRLLHISDTQMGYITNSEPGHGLLRFGGALVPFANVIPRDSGLYRLMSTNPNDK